MTKQRSEVDAKDCWNTKALYPDIKAWESDFAQLVGNNSSPRWPALTALKGSLHKGPEKIKQALELICTLERKLYTLYTYARMCFDEDLANEQYRALFGKISVLASDFQRETAWFDPELLALPQEKIDTFLASPVLSEYRFHLEKTIRLKPHILSADQEELLALSSQALQTSYKAFSSMNDADFKFGTIKDSKEQEYELTHGSYGLHIRSQDRVLRKNAYFQLHGMFKKYENTLCELLNGQTQTHLFNARAHRYQSCLEAALFPKKIDLTVYHSLISAVHEGLDTLHQFISLRSSLPGIDQLHLYDMLVPLTAASERIIPYDEGEQLVIDSAAVLGKEYQEVLRNGLQKDGWVDRYENMNKRSGAYSGGAYDTMPYILMNYKGLLRDVFTLAHEAGHSMHSYFSRKCQPYIYGDYSIFLAEVASTFNEELLFRLLMQKATTKEEKIYLLTEKLDDLRGTLFRQTMFAEFELLIHSFAEKSIPLTPQLLNEEYRKLNALYFGPDVVLDEEGLSEWARIPHFYYNFYVYQYATGISAALALADRVAKGNVQSRDQYLAFLKSGNSNYSLEILKLAGVDMTTPVPVTAAIDLFRSYVKELSQLLSTR